MEDEEIKLIDASPKFSQKDAGNLEEGRLPMTIYPFHLSNIHERSMSAYVARATPFIIFVSAIFLSVTFAFQSRYKLLVLASIFNVWMWLYLVSYALSTIRATRMTMRAMVSVEGYLSTSRSSEDLLPVNGGETPGKVEVVHLIILPNYKEDESILAATLEALSQAHGSHSFRIVLAMEEREGKSVTKNKAAKLQDRFGRSFADICAALHPLDLEELHLDGSSDTEVPGKSSNLKWAVSAGRKRCVSAGLDLADVVLTVADADCIFHPGYFAEIGKEFRELRRMASARIIGGQSSRHPWVIWQAPQLPFRNYFASLVPARLWGYVATVIEFGGVGGLAHAGLHMTFSSFSLPLSLVIEASPWDGDVIADDHHCYLKCFLYSIYQQACEHSKNSHLHRNGLNPPLVVRPIMLPVKSTSVVADNCVSSWLARFEQAKRHAQGVAEFSYILLGVFKMVCTLPKSAYNRTLLSKVCRVISLPFSMAILPTIQAFPFAAVSIIWVLNGRQVDECPSSIWLELYDPTFYMCMFAGGWNLGVNVATPLVLVIAANFYMMDACFLQPSQKSSSLWHQDDGDLPATLGSKRLTLLGLVAMDVLLFLPIVMPMYGLVPTVMAYWSVMVRGNRFNFISSSKVADSAAGGAFTSGRSIGQPQGLGRGEEDDVEVRQRQIGKTISKSESVSSF